MWFWKSLKLCFILLHFRNRTLFQGRKSNESLWLAWRTWSWDPNKCERGRKAGRLRHSGILFDGGKGITVAGVLWVWYGFLLFLRCLLQTPEVQLSVVRKIFGACSLKARRHFTLLCTTFKDLCVGKFAHEEKSFPMVSARLLWQYIPAMLLSPTGGPGPCWSV